MIKDLQDHIIQNFNNDMIDDVLVTNDWIQTNYSINLAIRTSDAFYRVRDCLNTYLNREDINGLTAVIAKLIAYTDFLSKENESLKIANTAIEKAKAEV